MPTGDLGQIADAVATRVVDALTERLAELITEQAADFRDRHERLTAQIRANGEREAETQRRVSEIERHIAEIETRVEFTDAIATMVYQKAIAELSSSELPPVPPELITACHRPAGTMHWVTLEVMGRQVHRKVAGGCDPEQVWRDMCESVRDHSGASDR